jgi:EAL domain-containing protein (putative c-di-GMP-specific phosphodiesterase class I)
VGLAVSPPGKPAVSAELLRQSDVAMYTSKARGKRRVTWFSPEFDRKRDTHQLIDLQLREALSEGHLQVYYQPLIAVETSRMNAIEALVRWERPDGAHMGPDKFIPVAEETGLIEKLGLWVLRRACIDAMDWGDIHLSVNVSAVQLRNPQFPLQMGQILEETGFPPARLELEITETFLIGDQKQTQTNLDMIRQFGVAIVLDDYGTGYASIGFLRRFRFDKLKLDRTLIAGAEQDEATRAVMVSSVAIAKALGMRVTAEGVETETHVTLARTAGCDQLQGWHFSKAIPAAGIDALMLEAKQDQPSFASIA